MRYGSTDSGGDDLLSQSGEASTTVVNGGAAVASSGTGFGASAANPVAQTITVQAAAGDATFNLELDNAATTAPSAYLSGWKTAANLLSEAIHDPITINIEIGYTEFPEDNSPITTRGEALGDAVYSETASYTQLRNSLAATGSNDVINALSDLPATGSLNGQTSFSVARAEAKAFGLVSSNSTAIDGYAGFGAGIPTSSVVAVALHEFTHAMGRINGDTVLSLFDYIGSGSHYFGDNGAQTYFSIDGGQTVLADFGITSDPADFLNNSLTVNDPFDEFYSAGTVQSLTSLDLTMLDMLGFGSGGSTMVFAGGALTVSAGRTSNGVTVLSGGTLIVASGGTASGTLLSGGSEIVSAGGVDSGAAILGSTGSQYVLGAAADAVVSGGIQLVGSGGTASGTLIGSGGVQSATDGGFVDGTTDSGSQDISRDGLASNTTVGSHGRQAVYSGGTASGTTIDGGGLQYVTADATVGGTVLSGGEQDVSTGGFAQTTTIDKGGAGYVYSGGIALGTSINSGGTQTVSYNGVASNTAIGKAGVQDVGSNGVASNTTLSSGVQNVYYSGAHAIGTTIDSGGREYVVSGGIASNTTINGGGELDVSTDAFASATTVNGGGTEYVYYSGARGIATTIDSGGALSVSSNGIASATAISAGGSATIGSGATAIATTIAGGTLELLSDAGSGGNGGAAGGITFSGSGGTLRVDGMTMPTATISGFAVGDTIDLAGIGFDPAGSATLTSGNVLQISADGSLYSLDFDPDQVFSGSFQLAADGRGGTQVTDPAAAADLAAPVARSGEEGATIIPVSDGNQTLTAGAAPEVFDFASVTFGNDTIVGFDPASDAIQLSDTLGGSFAAVAADMSATAAGTSIVLDKTHSLLPAGVGPGSLTAANFRFA